MFTWIEARVEGDHLARLQLDRGPLTLNKIVRKTLKHLLWAALAAWTAITFVGYFTPIRELLPTLVGWQVGPWEGFWLIFYAAFTYVQAGLAREAVCQHMCPYSRFQGVMFDPATRSAAYDSGRGEPRSSQRRSSPAGDCIDCGICVQVCPTGIDIRDGLQYACINCGLCIDACDQVMTRIGAPTGLIRFASENELAAVPRLAWFRRPRVVAYAALLLVFAFLGGWTVSRHAELRFDVLRDRAVLARETADGQVENAYTLQVMNLSEEAQEFTVAVLGDARLQIVGPHTVSAAPGSIAPLQVTVAAPAGALPAGTHALRFHVFSPAQPALHAEEASTFRMP